MLLTLAIVWKRRTQNNLSSWKTHHSTSYPTNCYGWPFDIHSGFPFLAWLQKINSHCPPLPVWKLLNSHGWIRQVHRCPQRCFMTPSFTQLSSSNPCLAVPFTSRSKLPSTESQMRHVSVQPVAPSALNKWCKECMKKKERGENI